MDEVRPNGRGGFTRISKSDDEEKRKAEAEAAEKAGKKPGAFPGAAPPFGAKPKGEEDDAAKRVFEEEKARKADASGGALAGDLKSHVQELSKLISDLEEHEEEEPTDVHMKKLTAAHKRMGSMCEKYMSKAQKNDVEKVGRKMAKDRLDAFSKAIDTLQQILSQLLETPAKESEHKPDPGDPQGAPKGWSPSNPSGVPSGAAGTAGGWTGGKSMDPEMTETLKRLEKKIDSQASEIETLKRGGARSNSLPVNNSGGNRNGVQKGNVSWPLDMNATSDRGAVNKNESFLDDE